MAEVAPGRADAQVDTEDGLRLTGFGLGSEVRLRTEVDGNVAAWACEAVFRADEEGSVDTARDAPVAGDWTGVDPFGPYWSADLEEAIGGLSEQPLRVTVTATDGATTAEAAFERRWCPPDTVELDWEGEGVVGRLVRPANGAVAPGVVHLSGSGGGLGDLKTARLLAGHGIASLAIGFWNLPGLPDEMLEIPVEVVARAAGRLRAEPGVPDHPVTVVGVSRGGELALLAGAHLPEQIGSTVSVVGSGAPWGAFGPQTDVNLPAWTLAGVPLPKLWEDDRDLDLVLAEVEAVRAAEVPVERTRGRVLLISGEADAMWPCTPLSQIAVDRAARHGAADRAEHIAYADAGHLAGTPPGFAVAPSIRHPVDDVVYPFGGSRAGNNTARRDGWRRQVAFVRSAPSL